MTGRWGQATTPLEEADWELKLNLGGEQKPPWRRNEVYLRGRSPPDGLIDLLTANFESGAPLASGQYGFCVALSRFFLARKGHTVV